MKKDGLLILEDGTIFCGNSVGAEGVFTGELVCNTSMTGYQEILSDPSYAGQMVCFTYPHIGNVGINVEDWESFQIQCGGVIMKNLCKTPSSWRSTQDLQSVLKEQNVVAVSGIDTRKLARMIRDKGHLKARLIGGNSKLDPRPLNNTPISLTYEETTKTDPLYRVILLDFGVKKSIIRTLVEYSCHVIIIPPDTSFEAILALQPDGIVLSNGPGDPTHYSSAIATLQALLNNKIPLFGICLGHQLLSLASGAKIIKMRCGHRGSNHPILEVRSNKVFMSCQNHSFVIEEKDLPPSLIVTHRFLLDGTIAGVRRQDTPAFGFQGHPEASPGPHELKTLFLKFIHHMRIYAKKKGHS